MARGPVASLFRAYASKHKPSSSRIFLCNHNFHSLTKFNNWVFQSYHLFELPSHHNNSITSINPNSAPFSSINWRRAFSSFVPHGDNDDSSINLELEGKNSVDFVASGDEIHHVGGTVSDPLDVRDESDNQDIIDSSNSVVKKRNVALIDPIELYQELRNAENHGKIIRSDWDSLQEIFDCFSNSGWAANQALAIYIGRSFFPTACNKFRNFVFKKCSAELAMYLVQLGPSDAAVRFLFPIFVEYCIEEFPDEIKRFRSMLESADLTKPHTWFPFARAMKRKIVYHCGPTNSGKTYNALQRFMEAKKGVYCSPLRLLAMEVFDKVNGLGIYCSLLTGQEKKEVPFSNHVACTVEMVSTDELYDVAVVDEIQMMADPFRGYAWTRALLGLKADEIHLCGDPSVLNIVRNICSETGDELVENHYGRFKPLVVEAKTLTGELKNVRSGDCVVAFSRREIFEVKLAIEKNTKHRCCVIYGALPPETRRQQANLFNDQDNEFDVLVASDAVGMGLNLNIRRVVFYNLSKYNGDKMVPVSASQVKQIAGRAGRRGSRYPDGLTTTLNLDDLNYLIECLKQPFDDIKKVGLFPFFEQVELFAGQLSNVTFPQMLEKFGESCRLDGSYYLCRHDHIKKVANMLEKVQGLSLEDRFNFCFAPVNVRDPKAMYHLLRFASSYSNKAPVAIAMGMPRGSARNDAELLDLETKHQVLSMYLWLSNQFAEETFPYKKKAEAMATEIADLLGESLINARWKPEPKQAEKPKPQQKGDGYDRPSSIIRRYKKRTEEKQSSQESSKKVAV
ncbi:DExH-box ATP-dependent RNA helicase DExH18, mitochondrial [Mercurialis annua]|uniref:DExH-box ATP-dependent RNA helicase DExH18, mitochondrial n=1 Tax=Mercurialis annua TaxID=3986 RepID=UPI0021610758|nr:DExH-box ATP-dependent RNA helicase DExH18, mitochondrial [Mercurialis annua]